MPQDNLRELPQGSAGGRSVTAVLSGLLIIVLTTAAIYGRLALSADQPTKVPLTVSTTTYRIDDSFTRQASYLGLVNAGKKAELGFEVAGQIATLTVRQGSEVNAGDVIATLDDASLQSRRRSTAADLEQARTELELARLKAKRHQSLSTTGAVSKESFDESRLQARALASRVEATEARLESIDLDLAKTRLLAPYDGIIAEQHLHTGAIVAPGTSVARLLEQGRKEAHIGVSASRAARLKVDQHYILSLGGTDIDAQLLSVRGDVDPVTRAATAVFALPAGTSALDGEPISLSLPEQVEERGGWLPLSSLLEGRRGLWTVLRIESRSDTLVTVREAVEVLEVQGDRAYVRGTVPTGALVVSDGVHRLTAGNAVAVAGTR